MTRYSRRAAAAALAALLTATAATTGTASAQTLEESAPETPATNDNLPIIHTYRGSDHLKANILNPRPVCNSAEDFRTVVYKVTDNFLPVGTISTTNLSDKEIPLQQELSRTQEISASVNGSKTETLELGGQASKKGMQGNIGYSIAKTLGWDVSGSLSWTVGQQIGPYKVPAGNTGEASYGFRTVTMTGTQQHCKPNGTWGTPTAWVANMPVKNEVRVKNYSTPADSWAPNKGAQVTKPVENPNPSYNADVEKLNEGESLDDVNKVADSEAATVTNKEIDLNAPKADKAEADTKVDAAEKKEVKTVEDSAAAENKDADSKDMDTDTDTSEKKPYGAKLDLEPYFTTSSAKAKGFAGSVALRVKNTGTDRYWGEFPAVTFRVEVHTEDGPEGVDRLVTTTKANGAHIRDLGYNHDKGVRTFEVTLSNPVNAGDDVLLGAFSFGDGKTKEGRLTNYMTVTQTGRLDGDTSTANDQNVDSRKATLNDFGKPHDGLF